MIIKIHLISATCGPSSNSSELTELSVLQFPEEVKFSSLISYDNRTKKLDRLLFGISIKDRPAFSYNCRMYYVLRKFDPRLVDCRCAK